MTNPLFESGYTIIEGKFITIESNSSIPGYILAFTKDNTLPLSLVVKHILPGLNIFLDIIPLFNNVLLFQ